MFVLIALVIGFVLSFFGFRNLVAHFYPLIGYLGLLLSGILIVTSFRWAKVRR